MSKDSYGIRGSRPLGCRQTRMEDNPQQIKSPSWCPAPEAQWQSPLHSHLPYLLGPGQGIQRTKEELSRVSRLAWAAQCTLGPSWVHGLGKRSHFLSYQGSAEAGAGYLGIRGLVGDSKLTWGDRAPHCISSGGQQADLEGHSVRQLQLRPASPCSISSASALLESMGNSARAWHQGAPRDIHITSLQRPHKTGCHCLCQGEGKASMVSSHCPPSLPSITPYTGG